MNRQKQGKRKSTSRATPERYSDPLQQARLLNKISADYGFKQSLKAITDQQCGVWKDVDSTDDLMKLAYLAVGQHASVLESFWGRKSRKTFKALKGFPGRLERMADEVERVTAGDPYFFARRQRDRGEPEILDGQKFKQLPEIMRAYAKSLRDRNATVQAANPHSVPRVAICEFSSRVKLFTGRYRDSEVASLLNHACLVLNVDTEFDAPMIAQARYRFSKRSQATDSSTSEATTSKASPPSREVCGADDDFTAFKDAQNRRDLAKKKNR